MREADVPERRMDEVHRQRLEAELIQAQKMETIGQLVSGIAHELNNPLAAILGFSQLIRRDPDLPADLRQNAELLVEEANRTRRIVQNLLDFTRGRPPERHPTSIAALVESVVALQAYTLGQGGIEVELGIPDDLPAVELDRSQLQQVLVNLTHNAAYAIKSGGGSRIGITAACHETPDGDRVRITVADDGPGVDPVNVGRLFEAFFTTKPPNQGTGLGLAVSRGIVWAHGGDLTYAPNPLGRGATFTFELPVHSTTSPSTAGAVAPTLGDAPPAAQRVAAGRVLVLDDEPSIRIFLAKALVAIGYEAVVASTGREAIAAAREGAFAALLVDHQMQGMTGIDVYHEVVAERPDLAPRFVMISGDVLNSTLSSFAADNGVTLLAKPFDLDTLERTVHAVEGA